MTYEFFSDDELRCRCGCGTHNMDASFMTKLVDARRLAGIPFRIACGCRCPAYNARLSKTKGIPTTGRHVATETKAATAVDIDTDTAQERGAIVKACMAVGLTSMAITPGGRGLHVDGGVGPFLGLE